MKLWKKMTFLFLLLGVACGPSGNIQSPMFTQQPDLITPEGKNTLLPSTTDAPTPLWTSMPTAVSSETPTPSPTLTQTPIPAPTSTPWPTLESNRVQVVYVTGNSQNLWFSLKMPVSSGDYWAEVDGNQYNCYWLKKYKNILGCKGPSWPSGMPFTISLYAADGTMVLQLDAPSYPLATATNQPVLSGNPDWICEVEPLWVAPLTGPYGCYAATCYSRSQGGYVGGTANSCEDGFPYYLYITPHP